MLCGRSEILQNTFKLPSPAHPEAFWWRLPVPSLLPTCPAFLPGSLCGVGGGGRARFLPPSQSLRLGRRCPEVKFCPTSSCSRFVANTGITIKLQVHLLLCLAVFPPRQHLARCWGRLSFPPCGAAGRGDIHAHAGAVRTAE